MVARLLHRLAQRPAGYHLNPVDHLRCPRICDAMRLKPVAQLRSQLPNARRVRHRSAPARDCWLAKGKHGQISAGKRIHVRTKSRQSIRVTCPSKHQAGLCKRGQPLRACPKVVGRTGLLITRLRRFAGGACRIRSLSRSPALSRVPGVCRGWHFHGARRPV